MSPSVFAPDLGKYANRLWQLTSAAKAGELGSVLDKLLEGEFGEPESLDSARLQFSASLLKDVLRAGGRVWVRDSRILVAWPEWSGPEGRRNAQVAMEAARELRPLNSGELARVQPLFAPD